MPPTKRLRKAPASEGTRVVNDRVPSTRKKPGACDHQDKAPCFMVRLPHQKVTDYHWPDEPGAVMFALRQSRDIGTSATVYDPNGNVICSFEPRLYDVRAIKAHYYNDSNIRLLVNQAQPSPEPIRDQPSAKPLTKGVKPMKKATPPPKRLRKKA